MRDLEHSLPIRAGQRSVLRVMGVGVKDRRSQRETSGYSQGFNPFIFTCMNSPPHRRMGNSAEEINNSLCFSSCNWRRHVCGSKKSPFLVHKPLLTRTTQRLVVLHKLMNRYISTPLNSPPTTAPNPQPQQIPTTLYPKTQAELTIRLRLAIALLDEV
jgi:hypothetical protein